VPGCSGRRVATRLFLPRVGEHDKSWSASRRRRVRPCVERSRARDARERPSRALCPTSRVPATRRGELRSPALPLPPSGEPGRPARAGRKGLSGLSQRERERERDASATLTRPITDPSKAQRPSTALIPNECTRNSSFPVAARSLSQGPRLPRWRRPRGPTPTRPYFHRQPFGRRVGDILYTELPCCQVVSSVPLFVENNGPLGDTVSRPGASPRFVSKG
jgi:hypothetical protein